MYHIQSGDYRIVPNTFDNAGGCFAMFGSNPAPGEKVQARIKTPPPAPPVSVKTAPKPDGEGQGSKPQARISTSTAPVDMDMRPRPVCSSTSRKPIRKVWWGGGIGPKLLHLQRCLECRAVYHGKTGKRINYLHSQGMGWSVLITCVFGLSLAGARNDAGFILIPFANFIFPLMVAPYIYHRGRPKWALAVFIASWFAIGIPVALAAIWVSRKPIPAKPQVSPAPPPDGEMKTN